MARVCQWSRLKLWKGRANRKKIWVACLLVVIAPDARDSYLGPVS